ncbi:hypothetical protein TRIP_B210043 [uncultured Desulfatiglans sp.]|nr:hypothetical protein TRIP_B210043 [uncultured Desulfatiglans sp.]
MPDGKPGFTGKSFPDGHERHTRKEGIFFTPCGCTVPPLRGGSRFLHTLQVFSPGPSGGFALVHVWKIRWLGGGIDVPSKRFTARVGFPRKRMRHLGFLTGHKPGSGETEGRFNRG